MAETKLNQDLCDACAEKEVSKVEDLLAKGADALAPIFSNVRKTTALELCIINYSTECLKLCLHSLSVSHKPEDLVAHALSLALSSHTRTPTCTHTHICWI